MPTGYTSQNGRRTSRRFVRRRFVQRGYRKLSQAMVDRRQTALMLRNARLIRARAPEIKQHRTNDELDSLTALVPKTMSPLNGITSGVTKDDRVSIRIRVLRMQVRIMLKCSSGAPGLVNWRVVCWQLTGNDFIDADNSATVGEYFDISAAGLIGSIIDSKADDVRWYQSKTLFDKWGVSNVIDLNSTDVNQARGQVVLNRVVRLPRPNIVYSGNASNHAVRIGVVATNSDDTSASNVAFEIHTNVYFSDV